MAKEIEYEEFLDRLKDYIDLGKNADI